MNVDSKFNKRSATQVPCNYTDVSHNAFSKDGHVIKLRFFGGAKDGNLIVHMNVLEAHRILEQLNAAITKASRAAIARATGEQP